MSYQPGYNTFDLFLECRDEGYEDKIFVAQIHRDVFLDRRMRSSVKAGNRIAALFKEPRKVGRVLVRKILVALKKGNGGCGKAPAIEIEDWLRKRMGCIITLEEDKDDDEADRRAYLPGL
jgi:hypothetical protein